MKNRFQSLLFQIQIVSLHHGGELNKSLAASMLGMTADALSKKMDDKKREKLKAEAAAAEAVEAAEAAEAAEEKEAKEAEEEGKEGAAAQGKEEGKGEGEEEAEKK
jgi:hypothetical protein